MTARSDKQLTSRCHVHLLFVLKLSGCRLESESEARRTLIELSLQAASPAADQTDERFGANSGAATRISGGVGSAAERHGPVGLPLTASGLTRGVSPEKGASLWAGVGIGAMLQVRGRGRWQ